MTDTTNQNPNTLAPVQSGQNAFGNPNPGVQVTPQTPSETLDGHGSKLDQILAALQKGDGKAAGDVVDGVRKEQAVPEKPAEKQPETEAAATTETAKVESTGNKALDIAVQTFVSMTGTTEADVSKAMELAYATGDVNKIDTAFLKERYGDKADQAIALVQAVFEADVSAKESLLKDVYNTAGGEEQFKRCVDLFKQGAKPALQAVVKNMLDSGDAEAVRQAAALIAEYGDKSGAFVQKQGDRLNAQAGVVAGQGLSRDEFLAARRQLNPMSRSYRSDFDKLIELRQLGKASGK